MPCRLFALVLGGLAALPGCVEEAGHAPRFTGPPASQRVTYVGKQTTSDFTGLGQHLQYWPLFGRTSGQSARRTDDEDCIERTPGFANFEHHTLLETRTFSNDALGDPIGTKTAGGFPAWAMFTLPDGQVGRSGTFYDESNVDNSNNTVNGMRLVDGGPTTFCLGLVTDNTAGEHDADVRLEARADTVDVSLEGHPDLSFDGVPDLYTFRYEGMQPGDLVKIRFQCSSTSGCQGAGLGGILVSDAATCAGPAVGPDARPGDASGDASGSGEEVDAQGCGCRAASTGSIPSALPWAAMLWMWTWRRRRQRTAAPRR